jgi:hypothetical protein
VLARSMYRMLKKGGDFKKGVERLLPKALKCSP